MISGILPAPAIMFLPGSGVLMGGDYGKHAAVKEHKYVEVTEYDARNKI